MFLLPVLLTLALLAPGAQDEQRVDERHGFRISVPAGWNAVEQNRDDGTFVLYLLPPGSRGDVMVGVTVRELGSQASLEALVASALARVRDDPAASRVERTERELLGESRPAVRARYATPQGELALEATFLVERTRGFAIQIVAPADRLDRHVEELAGVAATFAPVEPSEEALRALRLEELAARCGSEVDWAADWEDAAARARELDRPVLVVVWLYGSFALPITPRSSTFMDPDVIELVGARYVPYWHRAGTPAAWADRYGLSQTAFGQALLVVTPEGEVLAESAHATKPDVAYAFLRAAPGAPDARRNDAGGGGTDQDRARSLVAHGELEQALALLDAPSSPSGWVLRARALRLSRRGEEALAALERGRALAPADGDGDALRRELLAEEARTSLRVGRTERALEACESLLTVSDGAGEAWLLLALLEIRAGQREDAQSLLEHLVERDPQSRWAWQAAALLSSGLLELDLPLDLRWPEEALLAEAIAPKAPAALLPDEAREARDAALAWLLAAQRPDGSWASPTELSRTEDGSPSPFVDAVTAIAARALLAHPEDERALAAASSAEDFLLASVERREHSPTRVLYMDYTPWSDGAVLETLAALREARLGSRSRLRAAARALADDLEERAQAHGGWGYYVTSDLGGSAAPPTSMSFTTAATVLALARAQAAGLAEVDDLLGRGADALARMRDERGLFAYSLQPGGGAGVADSMAAGATGRGPACELALLRAGASDEQRLARSLELFLENADSLAAEQGKVLMHAGPQGQGCHYVLFDYAWAAEACRALGGEQETRVRLLELLLDCRQADGSFLDTPINGRAYGTASALLALNALLS